MDNVLRGNFGKPNPKPAPFDIRFGESQGAIHCSNCKRLEKVGFFVVWKSSAILVCIHCTGEAIMKYQSTHLFSKAVEIDAEVPPEKMAQAIEAVAKENPDVPEEKVAKIVRSAIEKI